MKVRDRVRTFEVDEQWFNNRYGVVVETGNGYSTVEFECFGQKIKRNIDNNCLQLITPKPFGKEDLFKLDGAICVDREGTEYIVFGELLYTKKRFMREINHYNKELKHFREDKFDIMQVTYNNEIVFKREKNKPYEYEIDYYDKRVKKHLNQYFENPNSQIKLIDFLCEYQDDIIITQIHYVEVKE